jgi:uncharacterized protein YbjT (DUF2867 family)
MDIDATAPVISRAEMLINAPLEVVWRIQADVCAWPTWRPEVGAARLDGVLAVGSVLGWEEGGLQITSTVQQVEPLRRVVWTGTAQGIQAVHAWRFTPTPTGVLVHTEESWSGAPVSAQAARLQPLLDGALQAWLGHLKRTAERDQTAVKTGSPEVHASSAVILVTGATGQNGRALIEELAKRAARVRAFVRDRTRAQEIALPGVELVEGDFADPDSFAPALDGVEHLFLLIPSSADVERQQRSLVDAATRCGVKHIVKLSQFGADEHASGRFQRYHAAIEQHIRASGIAYTFLRPNLFMQGLLLVRSTIASEGAFYLSAGEARVSVIDVREIARVAARVLTEPGHAGKTYELTGPEALTHADMAARLSEAMDRPVRYVDIPSGVMRQALLGFGLPRWQADGILEDYEHYRRGEAATVTTTVQDITGRRPGTFSDYARDYAAAFGGLAPATSASPV